MEIIGAGFGRTGTMSLRAALEELGFGPCYHMLEVFKHPAHIKLWQAAAEGENMDWEKFLGAYKSGLDYPLSAFYQDLLEVYPEAKVILTVRDPELWYQSTLETIYQGTAIPAWFLNFLPPFKGMKRMVQLAIWERLFKGRFEDRSYAIGVFQAHIEEVKRAVPQERLLVFDVKDGWEPLCEFLSVPVPEHDFPHINDRRMTKTMYLASRMAAGVLMLGLAGLVYWILTASASKFFSKRSA